MCKLVKIGASGFAQLVGQHGEELVLAFVGLGQLARLPAQFVFEGLALGEVAEDFDVAVQFAVAQGGGDAAGPELAAVLADQPHVVARPAGLGGGAQLLVRAGPLARPPG